MRRGRAALHTLSTDQTTYDGANVLEAAQTAGLRGRLLRRLHFTSSGEVDGVRRAEVVWQLDAAAGAQLDWQPLAALGERERGWAEAACTPPANVPWMHAGWHGGARAWLDAELAAQGLRRAGEPTVLKHGQISALWRVPTDAGPLYFKAVPDFFAREVEFTPLLARELPGAAPPVLAADRERGFLLLGDCGEVSDTPDLNALMTHLARVQRSSRPHLSGWGLRDRGPEYVLGWLDALFSDEVLMLGQEGGLSAEEAGALRTARPELEAALHRLAASPLPRTLGHGDLHGGNVTVQDGAFTLLDWSDVCLTHPFLDANPAYFFPHEVFDGDWSLHHDVLDAARDAYLHAWTDSAPLDSLRALFADALRAGELFRALGYVDGIQDAVEDKTEWQGAHLDHLRRLLTLPAP
ncbi:hypothetical protein CVO96_07810 [Deinococcus koreensis]|uniref:Aminoglycoside phosphotransferase domain-containing protein n=1 Tax=Deinococcus koreensis TaxID=2054903 RepID=A0A2K3UXR8_9DEIO|nr:hypothetical protein CVO96_07810 [Deinococcus koreensis]